MPVNLSSVMDDVRNLIPGLTVPVMPDGILTTHIKLALNRLNEDAPNIKQYALAGTGAGYYSLPVLISDWVPGESAVVGVISPVPTVAGPGSADIVALTQDEHYEIFDDGTAEHLRFFTALGSAETALVSYRTPWRVSGLNGWEAASTLPPRLENALMYMGAAICCFARAGQMSGTSAPNIAADVINYRSKESEYRRTGQEWERMYEQALKIGRRSTVNMPAAIARRNYPTRLQTGDMRMTHRTNK